MTADQVKGKGFRGALRYNLEKVDKGVAKLLDTTFSQAIERAIMNEIRMVRVLRPNLAKYFYHTSINFPLHENLEDGQMTTIAKEYLDSMGFNQHQYAIFRHFDADHPHLHILVNRIGYDGTVVSDSKDYQRSEAILRELEKQHGLTEVISSRQAQERAMTKNELEMMKRTDEPSVKMKLQVTVKNILEQKPDTAQFISQLAGKGIDVLFNQAGTGFISGISYGYEGMQFKGAHLGNAYKWQAIKSKIRYEQKRDRATIHEANIRTRAGLAERTGQAAGDATTRRTGADTDVITANTEAIQQGTGKLQGQIGAAHRKDGSTAQGNRRDNEQHFLPGPGDRSQHRNNQPGKQQGGQQVDHQVIPGGHFIGSLLGTDHPDGFVPDAELIQNRRKKRKKKRGQSL